MKKFVVFIICVSCCFTMSACRKNINESGSTSVTLSMYTEVDNNSAENSQENTTQSEITESGSIGQTTGNSSNEISTSSTDNSIVVKPEESLDTGIIQDESIQTEETQSNFIDNQTEEKVSYKLYYIVDSGVVGIMGFDDGVSNSDVSNMISEIEKYGYTVKYVEQIGENNIIVPNTIDGYSVYAIDGGAFCNCISIESIMIPDSVMVIEPGAFSGCSRDLMIYGNINSEAYTFAQNNSIKFEQKVIYE